MRKPPVTPTNPEVEATNQYLFGDKVLFGFPHRTYFELYEGMCSSDKIYSVQTKDFTPDAAAVIYYPSYNIEEKDDELATDNPVGTDHIFVLLTDDLVSFLEQCGITSDVMNYQWGYNGSIYYKFTALKEYQNAAFVNPKAFEWLTEEQVKELPGTITPDAPDTPDDPNDPNDPKEDKEVKQKKTTALLAGIIALFSLLN